MEALLSQKHATIGVTTVLINEKLVEIHEPFTTITLDTPAGLVRVSAEVKNGIAQNVTFQNIPSYLCDDNLLVTLCNGKQVRCAVAYSGSFFALADVHGHQEEHAVGIAVHDMRHRAVRILIQRVNAVIRAVGGFLD